MKQCSKCHAQNADFYTDKRASDGLQSQCKRCTLAGQAANYERNKPQILAYEAARYVRLKPLILQKCKAYYASNQAEVRARVAAYRAKNAAAISLSKQQKRAASPALYKAIDRARYLANPGAYKSRARARDKKLLGQPGFTETDVLALLKLQRGQCACCRVKLTRFEIDHVDPLALGGAHSVRNIQLLCRLCNRQKHATHPIDFMQSKGYLL